MNKIIKYCNEHLGLNIDYPKNDNELFKLYIFLQGILNYDLRQMLKEVELPFPNTLTETTSNIKESNKVFIYNDSTDEYDKFWAEEEKCLMIYDNGEYLEIEYKKY